MLSEKGNCSMYCGREERGMRIIEQLLKKVRRVAHWDTVKKVKHGPVTVV